MTYPNLFHTFILAFVLFLSACTSVDQKKVTGLCGSCKPYYVRGSMHYPQHHYDYDEQGLASWYGPGFHGKPKPLGEKFNQHTMTAAHKTLPLPTIVRVTNLDNGKMIKVLVDDRGPFVYDGRIIDLSMEAAKRLGCYQKGIARVRVQALVEESDALSKYLAKYGHHMSKDRLKRTWLQIYEQEINGNRPIHEDAFSVPFEARSEQTAALLTPKERSAPVYHRKHSALPKKVTQKTVSAPQSYSKKVNVAKAFHHKKLKTSSSTLPSRYVTLKQPFSTKAQALKELKKVNKKYPGRVILSSIKSGKPKFQIQVGPLSEDKLQLFKQ